MLEVAPIVPRPVLVHYSKVTKLPIAVVIPDELTWADAVVALAREGFTADPGEQEARSTSMVVYLSNVQRLGGWVRVKLLLRWGLQEVAERALNWSRKV